MAQLLESLWPVRASHGTRSYLLFIPTSVFSTLFSLLSVCFVFYSSSNLLLILKDFTDQRVHWMSWIPMTFSPLVLGEQGILHGGGRLFIVMENSECTLPVCDSHNYPLTHVSTHIRVCSKRGSSLLGTLGEKLHTALWPVSLRVSKSRCLANRKTNVLQKFTSALQQKFIPL